MRAKEFTVESFRNANEATSPAQQAAIAIAKKKEQGVKEEQTASRPGWQHSPEFWDKHQSYRNSQGPQKFMFQGYTIEFHPDARLIYKGGDLISKQAGDFSAPTQNDRNTAKKAVANIISKASRLKEGEGDPEGLPHLTRTLLSNIVDQVGTEGAHAIIKSLTWGDGASKELLHLIVNDLKDDIATNDLDEGWKDWVAGAAMGAAALGGATDADAKPVKAPQAQTAAHKAVAKTPVAPKAAKTPEVPQHLKIQPGEEFTVLSNNYTNEIALHKVATASGLKGIELAQFLAQMKHESWNFDRLKEKGQPRVKDYFAKRYDPKFAAKTAKILGNKVAGDGERYKGRGYIQLTGRDNYRMASQALGIDLVKHPELAERPEVAAKIAVWYWKTRVKPAVTNFADTTAVTKAINPAMRGLQDRHNNFLDYKRIL